MMKNIIYSSNVCVFWGFFSNYVSMRLLHLEILNIFAEYYTIKSSRQNSTDTVMFGNVFQCENVSVHRRIYVSDCRSSHLISCIYHIWEYLFPYQKNDRNIMFFKSSSLLSREIFSYPWYIEAITLVYINIWIYFKYIHYFKFAKCLI